mmetsp:Transcript_83960/g.133053  ORF Transcript_83960/g.133053 Transcript_83960/m.133053 type:complete len:202 (-) Transcript_83960:188-793(-)
MTIENPKERHHCLFTAGTYCFNRDPSSDNHSVLHLCLAHPLLLKAADLHAVDQQFSNQRLFLACWPLLWQTTSRANPSHLNVAGCGFPVYLRSDDLEGHCRAFRNGLSMGSIRTTIEAAFVNENLLSQLASCIWLQTQNLSKAFLFAEPFDSALEARWACWNWKRGLFNRVQSLFLLWRLAIDCHYGVHGINVAIEWENTL